MSDANGLSWLRSNLSVILLAAGLVGAGYITQDRVSAHEERLSRLEGWQRATERDLVARHEREAAAEKNAADLKVALTGVQAALGSVQLQLARLCVALRARCE